MGTKVKPSAPVLGLLLSSAFLLALLALFQWMELLVAEAGGKLSCSVNATLDCGPVWSSTAAKAIAGLARMPVAALGLVWGLAASAVAGVLVIRAATERELTPWIAAARWTALAGVLASLGLASVSLTIGVWCPTCLATYALAIAFAGAAVKLPGPIKGESLGAGLGWAVGIAAASYLALLIPASRAPQSVDAMAKAALGKVPASSASPAASPAVTTAPASPVASAPATPAPASPAPATPAPASPAPASPAPVAPPPGVPTVLTGTEVAELISALPPRGQQILADVILEYSMGETKKRAATDKPRFVHGSASAPVTMVEWTDVMCGHCAEFIDTLDQVTSRLPAGLVRIEPRQFPLDKECNPSMQHSDGTGTRCAAARALICLEGSNAFFDAQHAMFKEQSNLSKDRVIAIARGHAFDRRTFDDCLASPETDKKIQADVTAALAADVHGTPHILMNGKISSPFGPFLYVFLASQGRLDHPALAMLPKGQPPKPHDHAH